MAGVPSPAAYGGAWLVSAGSVRCCTGESQPYQQGGFSCLPQTPSVGQTLACIWLWRENEPSFLIQEGEESNLVDIHVPAPSTGRL